ncbi:unnamed protein product [Caenorhabditis sp. 36 PRJEB53466]|nr:unnamed protein product [Caenorhabditis sp. 36 PRJEB53466]
MEERSLERVDDFLIQEIQEPLPQFAKPSIVVVIADRPAPIYAHINMSVPEPIFEHLEDSICESVLDQTTDSNGVGVDLELRARQEEEFADIQFDVWGEDSQFFVLSYVETVLSTRLETSGVVYSAASVTMNYRECSRTTVTCSPTTFPMTTQVPLERTPLALADRDQLRAMIVLLNESNAVLLKIRQRFPLSASTRCDVIQRQIQIQLQELFGEFRSNNVTRFRASIPQNREVFVGIWNHLAQLIVDLCYHE